MNNIHRMSVAVFVFWASSTTTHAQGDDLSLLKQQAAELRRQNKHLDARLKTLEAKQNARGETVKALSPPESFVAQAAKDPLAALKDEGPVTWNGITAFGSIDAGLGWVSHGSPENPTAYFGESYMLKNANRSYFGIAPNNLAQSTLGLKGSQEILPGLSGVFMASTGFVPTSGRLADGPGTVVSNNGLNRQSYSLNGDGSRGGQPFNDELYVGLSSPTFGQLTFGRQRSFALDLVPIYDPVGGGYAFSVVCFSGTVASGLGSPETPRWDDALKYRLTYGPVRFGVMYKFADGNGGGNIGNAGGAPAAGSTLTGAHFFQPKNDAGQILLGASYGALDVDGALGYYHQAVAIGNPLSSAQLAGASSFTDNTGLTTLTSGNANANTISGVATDNTGWMIGAKYTWTQFKFFAGWAHSIINNPSNNVGVGAQNDQGGYIFSTISNFSIPHTKLLDTEWVGAKYLYDSKTDFTLSYFHVGQNRYGSAAQIATCAYSPQNSRAAQCAGEINAASLYADYHFTKRFDIYAGLMVFNISGGMSSGYLYYTNWAPTAGVRYTF